MKGDGERGEADKGLVQTEHNSFIFVPQYLAVLETGQTMVVESEGGNEWGKLEEGIGWVKE